METRCDDCGSPVGAEQAFCPRCGAVIGMTDAAEQSDEGWNLESTIIGKKPVTQPERPAPRPKPEQAPTPARPRPHEAPRPLTAKGGPAAAEVPGPPQVAPARVAAARNAAEQTPPSRGVNTLLLAVIGVAAVLLIGGLLLLLRYLNSQG
jgi:hypothetical protein